jgi:predicted DCC family thiol-disulfide oxidoreductase YuxK
MQSGRQQPRSRRVDPPVILFDGICNLCQKSVQFVIARDTQAQFRFASLQSDAGRRLLDQHAYSGDDLSSVILLEGGRPHRKSQAALRVVRRLDGLWPVLYYLFFWIPSGIADRVYDFIGARRYRWFGKKDRCWVPNDELRSRFLDAGEEDRPPGAMDEPANAGRPA